MLLRSRALNVTRLQPSFLSSCNKLERLCPYGSSKQCRGRHRVSAQHTATTEAPSALLIEPWTESAEQQQVGPQCMQVPAPANCTSAPNSCSRRCTASLWKVLQAAAVTAQALSELQRRLQSCPHGQGDEQTQKWFLRDRKLDVGEAEQKLTDMLRWRQEFKADDIAWDMVKAEAATGKVNMHDHKDKLGRPVIVVKVAKHVTGEWELDDSKRLCVYMLERAISQLPEGQETVLGIFDLRGFKNKNADLGFVRFLVDIFFTYYPKRLGQVLMLDAPWIFQPGWAVVKPWLGKYAGLVKFVKADELQSDFFTEDTFPRDLQ